MLGKLHWNLVAASGLLVFAVGCDCAGDLPSPCEQVPRPASCGVLCSDTEPCPTGFYCGDDGLCAADCNALSPCGEGERCDDEGRCVPRNQSGGDGGGVDANTVCADVRVETRRVTPNVVLIVDQSGSMDADFGGTDRWNAVRNTLMSTPDGLVTSLQSQVRFGLALFSSEAGEENMIIGECPLITWVDPALNNYDAINTIYGPADPIDETPTGASIQSVTDRVLSSPDPSEDPTVFILATDGEPDTCLQPNPQQGHAQALDATERAYEAGIRTFIISVGNDISSSHLQAMANAGLGRSAGMEDATFWVAGDDAGLRSALLEIVGGELSCELELNGSIQDFSRACDGTVILNGTTLPCDDPNGWRAVDATHIELVGDACDTLTSGGEVNLQATFPCGVILI